LITTVYMIMAAIEQPSISFNESVRATKLTRIETRIRNPQLQPSQGPHSPSNIKYTNHPISNFTR
jgi:hypothetical protein